MWWLLYNPKITMLFGLAADAAAQQQNFKGQDHVEIEETKQHLQLHLVCGSQHLLDGLELGSCGM